MEELRCLGTTSSVTLRPDVKKVGRKSLANAAELLGFGIGTIGTGLQHRGESVSLMMC